MTSSTSPTSAGNYFISNYPPFSFWKPELANEALEALEREPEPGKPLGLYLHVPFCRKRCHFCYFRIYTGKSSSEIQGYLDACLEELRLYAARPLVKGRKPRVVYFGGGTPSYLSVKQLTALTNAMKEVLPWDEAEEVTFECEPGTLSEPKIRFLREMGVTRLSLGVEHFDEDILRLNGRAHGAREIPVAFETAREVGFPQINIDLIAGMLGETDEGWERVIERTVEMQPDSVTIYQMEVPYNTTIYRDMMKAEGKEAAPVADWATKRRWVDEAFRRLEACGYSVNSTCTVVKDASRTRFLYREQLFSGADMLALGVASFGHVGGTHYQNEHNWDPYIDRIDRGELPIHRALRPTDEERLVRELVLQFKLGGVDAAYYRDRFGVDILEKFREPFEGLRAKGYLKEGDGERIGLSREALLKVDSLMLDFFLPQHRDARYT